MKNKKNIIFLKINNYSSFKIPYAQSLISAGFPSTAENFVENILSLDELMIKSPSSTFFVRVLGNSMSPTINNNDILIVDKSLVASNNKICVVRINDEFMVKRVLLGGSNIKLIADNKDYNETIVTSEMDFEIWGVVTFIIHQA